MTMTLTARRAPNLTLTMALACLCAWVSCGRRRSAPVAAARIVEREVECSPPTLSRFIDDPAGDPLRVDVDEHVDDGSSHYDNAVSVRVGGGAPVTFRTGEESSGEEWGGALVPHFRRRLSLDATHTLLIGWHSTGGGKQNIDAWLFAHDATHVRLVDWLDVNQPRGESAVALRRVGAALLLGVPLISAGIYEDRWLRLGRRAVHQRSSDLYEEKEAGTEVGGSPGGGVDPWLGGAPVASSWVVLPKVAGGPVARETPGVEWYCPPFGTVSRWPERFTWIEVRPDGFRTNFRGDAATRGP